MQPIKAAERTKDVKYAIRDIAVTAKEVAKTKKVIYLNVGDPNKFDFDTPKPLKKAVSEAMKNGHNYYSDSAGVDEALKAIAEFNNKLGIECTDKSIMISTGVSEAIQICIAALMNRGDNMLIPRPSYPVYTAYLNLFEASINFYTLNEKKGWELDTDEIERQVNDKTKAITIINPNNPTGGVYDKKTLQKVVDIAAAHNLVIFADEIYDQMIIDGEMHHLATFSKEVPVVTFNGLAKNYLAPGWRTGWLAITDRENKMEDYKNAIFQLGRARLCSITPQQFAVKPALESGNPTLKKTLRKLRKRRNIVYKRINQIDGLSLAKPKAAFYAFPKIEFEIDDKEFVLNLLKEEGVATVHGSGFDMAGHFRIVFLADEANLNEAIDKIEAYVKRIKK